MAPEAATKQAPAQADEAPPWAAALLDRIDTLEGELKQAKARQAAFKPMEPPQSRQAGIFAGMAPGPGQAVQREGVSQQDLVDVRGDKVPAMLLKQYPVAFAAGDRCRINPAATREGWPEGQTWGDVLARFGTEGVGVVGKVYWLNDRGEWKYSARIRGITGTRADGFLGSELLPF